jgi:hypothetical protein
MARRIQPSALTAGLILALAGCGMFERAERPAWRGQVENACLAQKLVQVSAFVQPARPIDGPGICGLEHPFKVTALAQGTVALNATQTIGCPLTAALDQWVADVVQPAALARFGAPVVRIDSLGSYACRPIDNQRNEVLSEHAFGNAIDIGGFRLADGREFSFVKGWNGPDDQVRAFLREVQAGACTIFTTVLAPGADMFHYNHMHVDLAQHGNTSSGPRRTCKPTPSPQLLPPPQKRDDLPDPPPLDEDLDSVQTGPAGVSQSMLALHALEPGIPPAPIALPRRSNIDSAPPLQPSSPVLPAPLAAARPQSGTIRPDGAYVPPGMAEDAGTTPSNSGH